MEPIEKVENQGGGAEGKDLSHKRNASIQQGHTQELHPRRRYREDHLDVPEQNGGGEVQPRRGQGRDRQE